MDAISASLLHLFDLLEKYDGCSPPKKQGKKNMTGKAIIILLYMSFMFQEEFKK